MNELEGNRAGPTTPAPSLLRDPWGWLSAAAVLPIILLTRGNPRAEPFAEDFDFLRRAILEGGGSWFDGGGSLAFWRPVSHQLYYQLLGNLVLDHPARVAAIHMALLALSALLLYRVFRREWSGPLAAAAASFPLLAESTRTLICWPSHFVDLGVFVFIVLAVHETAHRRAWSAVPAMFAALLCKELAVVGVLLLPFLPGVFTGDRRARMRWIAISAAVVAIWAVAYLLVRRHAGLELPHALERNPAVLAVPMAEKLSWAVWNSLRAVFSLARAPRLELTVLVAVGALALAALVIARNPAARGRYHAARGWVLWGAAWTAFSWAALAPIFPFWAPNRSQLGSVGFGVSAVALASAVHPAAPAVLVAARMGQGAANRGHRLKRRRSPVFLLRPSP